MKVFGKALLSAAVLLTVLLASRFTVAAEGKEFADMLEFIGDFASPDGKWERLEEARTASEDQPLKKAEDAGGAASGKPAQSVRERGRLIQHQKYEQGKSQNETPNGTQTK